MSLARSKRGLPRLILGPPGCGKTERLLRALERELQRGVPPDRVAFFAFTRAARKEVQDRVQETFGLAPEDMPWLRTIHSAAFRLLELHPHLVLGAENWAAFAERYAYRLSPGANLSLDDCWTASAVSEPDDQLRFAWEWAAGTETAPDRAAAACGVENISAPQLATFVKRIEIYQEEQGLWSFSRMLEGVLEAGLCPPVEVLFLDEAQDLSPLQVRVLDLWMAQANRVYVAGDDDQTVYGFQGADPSWLIDLAARAKVEVLTQSHRVPVAVHALAERIIARNRERLAKKYLPAPRLGAVEYEDRDAAFDSLCDVRSAFVLARNRFFLGAAAAALTQRAIPFVVEGSGGWSPLADKRLRPALEAADLLAGGVEPVSASQLGDLFALVSTDGRHVTHGVKARVEKAAEVGRVYRSDELRGELRLDALITRLRAEPAVLALTRLPGKARAHLHALWKRYGGIPQPRVIVTSIHGSKGREADTVVVFPEMTAATSVGYRHRGPAAAEAENRVFYVAATRARERLMVAAPRMRRHFDFPRLRTEEGVA